MFHCKSCTLKSIHKSAKFIKKLSQVRYFNKSRSLLKKYDSRHEYQYQAPERIVNSYLGQPSPLTHPHKLSNDEVSIGLSKDEFSERRSRLMFNIKRYVESNGANSSARNLVIIPASTVLFSAPDVPYPSRQESNFFYLTGYQEPDSVLVLHDDSADGTFKSILFVSPKDPQKELWEGPKAGVEGALYLTGVDSTGFLDDSKRFLDNFVTKFNRNNLNIFYDPSAVNVNASNLAKSLLDPSVTSNFHIGSPYSFVHELRWVKSKAEINLLRKSCDIASLAFMECMAFSRPDVDENHLLGKFDFECRINGARCLAYPPVIAGGARANTIHYLNADQLIKSGELLLMDAGCDYGGYASDITRCWPVSGKFSAAQKELYEMLFAVQTGLMKYANETRPLTLRDLFLKMLDFLSDGLTEMKIFSEKNDYAKRSLADHYCPHHVSHYLGIDVHDTDTVSKTRDLQPGVVITVEPGVYFKENDTSVPEQFRGIGLRIEDDVLITDTGVDILSKNCPKDVKSIEEIILSRT